MVIGFGLSSHRRRYPRLFWLRAAMVVGALLLPLSSGIAQEDIPQIFDPEADYGPGEFFESQLPSDGAVPFIAVGDPAGAPTVSPASRIDANVGTSPFSGVVSINVNNNSLCSGALISPNHVLTAAHCIDFAGGTTGLAPNDTGDGFADVLPSQVSVNFNVSGTPTNVSVSSINIHPDWHGFNNINNNPSVHDDLVILTLAGPAPSSASIYALSRSFTLSATPIWKAGYGTTGDAINGYQNNSASFTTKRTGGNVGSWFFLDDEGSQVYEVFTTDFDGPTLSTDTQSDGATLGNDIEVTTGPGDSGGPSFIYTDLNQNRLLDVGELTLFGVNTFGTSAQPFFGTRAGGLIVSGYQSWIDDTVAIPEPSAGVLLPLLGILSTVGRRKSGRHC